METKSDVVEGLGGSPCSTSFEPLQMTVPVAYLSAVLEQLRAAENPRITWRGDAEQAAKEAESVRMSHIIKARNMMEDLPTVGPIKACELHAVRLSNTDSATPIRPSTPATDSKSTKE